MMKSLEVFYLATSTANNPLNRIIHNINNNHIKIGGKEMTNNEKNNSVCKDKVTFLGDVDDDAMLRLKLVELAGFSLSEVPLVYQFIKGDDDALGELKEFRQWRLERQIPKDI